MSTSGGLVQSSDDGSLPFIAGQYYAASPPGGGVSTQLGAGNVLRAIRFRAGRSCTLTSIAAAPTGAGTAGSVVRLGLYLFDLLTGNLNLLIDAGTIDGTNATAQALAIAQGVVLGQTYFAAACTQGAPVTQPTMAAATGLDPQIGTPPGSLGNLFTSNPVSITQGGIAGALPAQMTPASYANGGSGFRVALLAAA